MNTDRTYITHTHTPIEIFWTIITGAENAMETDKMRRKKLYSEHVFFIRSSVFNHIYAFFYFPTRILLRVEFFLFVSSKRKKRERQTRWDGCHCLIALLPFTFYPFVFDNASMLVRGCELYLLCPISSSSMDSSLSFQPKSLALKRHRSDFTNKFVSSSLFRAIVIIVRLLFLFYRFILCLSFL